MCVYLWEKFPALFNSVIDLLYLVIIVPQMFVTRGPRQSLEWSLWLPNL